MPRPLPLARLLGFAAALAFLSQVSPAQERPAEEVPQRLLRELDLPPDASLDSYKQATLELGRLRARPAVPRLVEIIEKEGDKWRRSWAIKALGEIGDPAAIPALEREALALRPDPNGWWREVDIAAECRNAVAAIQEANAPLPVPPPRRPAGCMDPRGGRIRVVSRSPKPAAAWLEFLSAAGYDARHDDGTGPADADLTVLAGQARDFPDPRAGKVLVAGNEAREYLNRLRVYPGDTTYFLDGRTAPKVKPAPNAPAFARLLESPCRVAAAEDGFVLFDGTRPPQGFRVADRGGFPDHITGLLEEDRGRWPAFREENIAVWGFPTAFESMTPEGQRLLINLVSALVEAPRLETLESPLLKIGATHIGSVEGGRARRFRVRPEGHATEADLVWGCPARMALFEGTRAEGSLGPSPLTATFMRIHHQEDEAVIELNSFGLRPGERCEFSLTPRRGRLLESLPSPRRPRPAGVPATGSVLVALAAAALAFAAYASRRGLRVNAGKAGSLAVFVGAAGAATGYYEGLSTGWVQEGSILLVAGLAAVAAGRAGRGFRETRTTIYAGGALLVGTMLLAMFRFSSGN